MTLLRRALALVLALTLTVAGGPLPATAAMRGDALGTNHLYLSRVGLGPRLVALQAATVGNLLASPTDLSVSPPWYNPVGAPTTLSGTRLVVGPGDNRQTVVYQTISVTAGHTYIADANFAKVPGSGAGVPRVTFYKVGDPASTYAGAVVEQIGNYFHTFSTYTATATGDLRVNIEMPTPPPGSDNGCDVTFLNLLAFDTTAGGTAALPALRATTAATVTAPLPVATDATFAALAPMNFPTDLPPADQNAVPAGGATLAANAAGENTNVFSVDFRPGGNVTTREALDAVTFSHMLTGTQNAGQASDYDTANPSFGASYALIGRYAKGSANDNIAFGANGLTLGVVNKPSNGKVVKFGQARAAAIRFEPVFRRGMVQEVCAILPKSWAGWMPIWDYGGRQQSWKRIAKALPSAGVTGPYDQPVIDGATRYLLDTTGSYIEDDAPDGYDGGTGFPGRVLTGGVVYKGPDAQTKVPPHRTFEANNNGFENTGGLVSLPAGDEWWAKSHCFGLYLDDTRPYQVYTIDGRVYREEYNELYAPALADALAPHAVEPSMFHLIIGGQGIATFQKAPTGSGSLFDQGKPDVDLTGVDFADLGITVQKVSMWKAKLVPASRGTSVVGTAFAALSLAALPTAAGSFTTTIQGKTALSTLVVTSSNPGDTCAPGTQTITANDPGKPQTSYSVSTATLTCTLSGTADRTWTIVEHPTSYAYPDGSANLQWDTGRTTAIPVTINPNGVLATLATTKSVVPTGLPFAMPVSGAIGGSTLSGTVSYNGGTAQALSFNGSGIAYLAGTVAQADGTPVTWTVTETKAGATGSPKTTTFSATVKANLVPSQNFAGLATGNAVVTNNSTATTAPDGSQTAALVDATAGGGLSATLTSQPSGGQTQGAWIKTADANAQLIAHYNGGTADVNTFDGGSGSGHYAQQTWVYVANVQNYTAATLYQQGSPPPKFYVWGLAATAN